MRKTASKNCSRWGLIAVIALLSLPGHASVISLDPISDGELLRFFDCYSAPCDIFYGHEQPLDNLRRSANFDASSTRRGYMIYDLTDVSGTIESASLTLSISIARIFTLFNTATVIPYTAQAPASQFLASPTGAIEGALYDELVAGWDIAGESLSLSDRDSGIFDIALNAQGLESLNAGSQVVLGLRSCCTDLGDSISVVFDAAPVLRLSITPLTGVPISNTLMLFALALALLRVTAIRQMGFLGGNWDGTSFMKHR